MMTDSELARFEAKVLPEPMSGCWLWDGAWCGHGYGYLGLESPRRKIKKAATLSYEHFVGPVPARLELDHLCRVRPCVNPRHLEPVTRQVNQLRSHSMGARNAVKTHCPQGHPYDVVNERGWRRCLRCRRAEQIRYSQKLQLRRHASS